MPRCLFTVEDAFLIKGRGLVVVPGIVPIGEERIQVGDPLLLRRPDGTSISTTIGGLSLPIPNPGHEVVVLLQGFSKDEVPVGTEVWSAEGVNR
jgi:translation elongation factor EF-Tu-like GTPase